MFWTFLISTFALRLLSYYIFLPTSLRINSHLRSLRKINAVESPHGGALIKKYGVRGQQMYSLWVKIVKICFLHMAVKSNVLKLVFSYIYQNTEKCIRPPVFYTKLKNIHSFNLRGYRSCWSSDHQNWVIENILVDGSQILTHKRRRQQRINDSCMTGVSTCWCFTEFALKWWTIYHAIKLQLFQCSDTNCVICAWWMTHDTGSAIYRQNVCGCNQTQVTPKLRKCCKAWYYPVMATKSEVISQTHLDSVIYKVKGQLWGFPSNRQTYPRIQGSVWQKKG